MRRVLFFWVLFGCLCGGSEARLGVLSHHHIIAFWYYLDDRKICSAGQGRTECEIMIRGELRPVSARCAHVFITERPQERRKKCCKVHIKHHHQIDEMFFVGRPIVSRNWAHTHTRTWPGRQAESIFRCPKQHEHFET